MVNLYSADYYELCKSRLTENGVVCQWVPLLLLDEPDLRLVVKAFLEVFPDATLWEGSKDDYLLIGAKDGLKVDYQNLSQRMRKPALQEKLKSIGINNPEGLLATYMHGPDFMAEMTSRTPVTTDDKPYLEYSTSVKVNWDPRWRRRDISSLWGFFQNLPPESKQQIERESAAWQVYRELSVIRQVPGPVELINVLSRLRDSLAVLQPNAYLAKTISGFAAMAYQPDLKRLKDPAARLWAATLSGETAEAEKAREAIQSALDTQQQLRIENLLENRPEVKL